MRRSLPLDVSSPVRARRHFIQSFFWSPDNPAQPSNWTLGSGIIEPRSK